MELLSRDRTERRRSLLLCCIGICVLCLEFATPQLDSALSAQYFALDPGSAQGAHQVSELQASSLAELPGDCPSLAAVAAAVGESYPGASYAPAYAVTPSSCEAVPTLQMPDGAQTALVMSGTGNVSATTLAPGSVSDVSGIFSRWSGYEAYVKTAPLFDVLDLPNQAISSTVVERVVPTLSVPPQFGEENSSLQSECCSLSVWVGEADSPGGLADDKLLQIGIDMMTASIATTQGMQYVGFYEALPSRAVFFNSTQVPCGMPAPGQSYTSTIAEEGAYNSTGSVYALTFQNDGCAGSYYVVYVYYPLSASYAEVESEAPVSCIGGIAGQQDQLPEMADNNVESALITYGQQDETINLAQASTNQYVISLNATQDTVNTAPGPEFGQFSTVWLTSYSDAGSTGLC